MKNNKNIIVVLGIILLIIFGFWNIKTKNSTSVIKNEQVVQEFRANLKINDEKTNPTFNIQQHIGKTALEATREAVNGNIQTNGEGEKAFVTSINGRNADIKKREFWEFLVNGKQAEVGAGTYKIQNGDEIIWKISTY